MEFDGGRMGIGSTKWEGSEERGCGACERNEGPDDCCRRSMRREGDEAGEADMGQIVFHSSYSKGQIPKI